MKYFKKFMEELKKMSKELIEIPLDLYKALIREHLIHQNAPDIDDLIEDYVEMVKKRYWEDKDV